jgi:hypothetical protein
MSDGPRNARYMSHYIPARGYPGTAISLEERKEHIDPLYDPIAGFPEYLWSCTVCKKSWKQALDSHCEMIERSNLNDEPVMSDKLDKQLKGVERYMIGGISPTSPYSLSLGLLVEPRKVSREK